MKLWSASVLLLVACGGGSSNVVEDGPPVANAWTEISLVVTGPAASGEKRKVCIREAQNAGIRVREGAPRAGTLYLSDDGNKVTLPTGDQILGNWTKEAVCRVAVTRIAGLDEKVQVSKTEPTGCQPKGSVSGEDKGFAFITMVLGTYEGALAVARSNALKQGANVLVVDASAQAMIDYTVSGRAFACPVAAPPTPPETPPPPG